MRNLNEFLNNSINENLDKAKAELQKALSKYTQGFEIYIDDSAKKPTLVISIDELVDGGADYPTVQKAIDSIKKKYKLSSDKMSNDNVVFLNESSIEDIKNLHEVAYSKAQRRLFAIALQVKQGDIKKEDLSPEYAKEIIKLSELPEKTLRDFAEGSEKNLPARVEEAGESFACCEEPFAYPNFMHGFKGTNSMAKAVLMQFFSNSGATAEQNDLAFNNIMKIQHHLYTQFFLGNPGHAWLKESLTEKMNVKDIRVGDIIKLDWDGPSVAKVIKIDKDVYHLNRVEVKDLKGDKNFTIINAEDLQTYISENTKNRVRKMKNLNEYLKESNKINEGEVDMSMEFALVFVGGSIGGKPSNPVFVSGSMGNITETSNDSDSLKEKAKKMNKNLSPGEKKYYGMKYTVIKLTPAKIKEVDYLKSKQNDPTEEVQ